MHPDVGSLVQALCTGENPNGFSYSGSPVHHVVKGAAIVGGDVEVLSPHGLSFSLLNVAVLGESRPE